MSIQSHTNHFKFLPVLILGVLLPACGEYAAKGAGTGATTGAVSGAVGGLGSAEGWRQHAVDLASALARELCAARHDFSTGS